MSIVKFPFSISVNPKCFISFFFFGSFVSFICCFFVLCTSSGETPGLLNFFYLTWLMLLHIIHIKTYHVLLTSPMCITFTYAMSCCNC